jgi:carboxyl-terminal processing protease
MSPRGRLVVALVSTLLVAYVAVGSLLGRVFGDTTYGQLAVFNEVVRLVLDAYVEPVNIDRAMMGARMGLTDALDGDSAYLDADELRSYQQPPREGEAEIGVVLTRRFSFLMVAATRAGLTRREVRGQAGRHHQDDRRKALAVPLPAHGPAPPARGARLPREADSLRAGSDPIDLSVVRERLVAVAPERRMLADATGYIKLGEFTPRSADEVKSEIEALRRAGAHALVLDLRGSGAGAPAEGVKIAELFLKGGPVGKLTGTREDEQVFSADPARSAWDRPLAVLVDTGHGRRGRGRDLALLDAGAGRSSASTRSAGRACRRSCPSPKAGSSSPSPNTSPPRHGRPRQGHRAHGAVDVPDRDEDEAAPVGDPILDKALEVLKNPPAAKKAA